MMQPATFADDTMATARIGRYRFISLVESFSGGERVWLSADSRPYQATAFPALLTFPAIPAFPCRPMATAVSGGTIPTASIPVLVCAKSGGLTDGTVAAAAFPACFKSYPARNECVAPD